MLQKYTVKIWTSGGKTLKIEIDAENENEAAALAVNHYLSEIPDLDATTTIDWSLPDRAVQPMKFGDLVGWLKRGGQDFVKRESLQALVTRFTFD